MMKTAAKVLVERAIAQRKVENVFEKFVDNALHAHMEKLKTRLHELHTNPAFLIKPDGTIEPITAEEFYKTWSDSGAPIKKMEESP